MRLECRVEEVSKQRVLGEWVWRFGGVMYVQVPVLEVKPVHIISDARRGVGGAEARDFETPLVQRLGDAVGSAIPVGNGLYCLEADCCEAWPRRDRRCRVVMMMIIPGNSIIILACSPGAAGGRRRPLLRVDCALGRAVVSLGRIARVLAVSRIGRAISAGAPPGGDRALRVVMMMGYDIIGLDMFLRGRQHGAGGVWGVGAGGGGPRWLRWSCVALAARSKVGDEAAVCGALPLGISRRAR